MELENWSEIDFRMVEIWKLIIKSATEGWRLEPKANWNGRWQCMEVHGNCWKAASLRWFNKRSQSCHLNSIIVIRINFLKFMKLFIRFLKTEQKRCATIDDHLFIPQNYFPYGMRFFLFFVQLVYSQMYILSEKDDYFITGVSYMLIFLCLREGRETPKTN